jgi:hypothetical protein
MKAGIVNEDTATTNNVALDVEKSTVMLEIVEEIVGIEEKIYLRV